MISHSLYLLHQPVDIGLLRVIDHSRPLGRQVHAGLFHPRHLLEALFDTHSAGSAGHALKRQRHLLLLTPLCLRSRFYLMRLFRFHCHTHDLSLITSCIPIPPWWGYS